MVRKVVHRTQAHKPAHKPAPVDTSQELPINWPSGIPYLLQPTHTPSITPTLKKTLNTPTKLSIAWPKYNLSAIPSPQPSVQIIPVPDDHPSYPQSGLYATKTLAPGTLILPYLGQYHLNTPEDTNQESDYDINLDRELGVSIDSERAGNEARFINDYRGIRERVNAEFRDMWVRIEGKDDEGKDEVRFERWLGVFVCNVGKSGSGKNGIKRGEEVCVGYGKGFWEERKKQLEGGGGGGVGAKHKEKGARETGEASDAAAKDGDETGETED